MSDAVKWALLAAAAVALIALIVALPFVEFIDVDSFSAALTTITTYAGGAFYTARCLVNNFLSPVGRGILSGLMFWLFAKWAITISIKIGAWIYHFIFR